jgi:transposase, IS5 family
MVELRHHQRLVWEGWFPEQAQGWWEEWMRQADQVLDDDELLEAVYQAQGKRRPKSHCRGRKQTPAEVLLRLAVLKHVRNWSFEETEREVRANVVYRQFTRIGAEKVPDAKTLGRLVQALGPQVVQQVHQRLVAIAQEKKVVRGRKLRLDTTVVEKNIHYPTDSSLLSDGARVLTRTMKKITALTGRAGAKLRNRMRTIGHRAMEIARTSRSKGPQVQKKLKQGYRKLLTVTRKVVNQAKRFRQEIASGVKRAKDHDQKLVLAALRRDLETMLPRVQQVIRQAKARVLAGNVHVAGKLVSVFEPSTEVIRKGKASKPTEFGKMVKVQEAENQIITHYEVFEKRPYDADLLVPAVCKHEEQFGRVPQLVAGDAGFYSADNEAELQKMGVRQISVPNRSTKSPERRRHQKKRFFRRGQKWRTGAEGRISVLKRRHGLNRCRYRGEAGMQRWVGLGVIADNLINIGRFLAVTNSG